MIVQLPSEPLYGAAYLNGWTRSTPGGAEVLRGVVVVKGAYDLVADGTEVRRMVASTDPGRATIVFSDQGAALPDAKGYDLTYEADIALEKARTDIVVEGQVSGATGGAVQVDGDVWIRRGNMLSTSNDTGRNLFGWLSKTADPRKIDVTGFPPVPPADKQLPDQYDAGFNNVHQRGGAFSTPGNRNLVALPATGTVEVFKEPDPSDDDTGYAFRLPGLTLTARLRAYCGHGPDQAPFWRVVEEVDLDADTLVVVPATHSASLLWRAHWSHDSVPTDFWRKVQILQRSA